MRTHYDNLHVSENASPEVIRAAYKALAQKWHPDRNPDHREKSERYFKIITAAYEVLSDPVSRAEYDAWLAEQRKSDEAGAGLQDEPESPSPVVLQPAAPRPQWPKVAGYCALVLVMLWANGRYDLSAKFLRIIDPQRSQQATVQQPAVLQAPTPPQPQPKPQQQASHEAQIYRAHPDAAAVVASPAFVSWVSSDAERLRIADSGTADEVIGLLSQYKQFALPPRQVSVSAPLTAREVDAVLGNLSGERGCEFKQTMTDEDYAACGLAPPER